MKKSILCLVSILALSLSAAFAQTGGEQDKPKINKKNLIVKEWNVTGKAGSQVLDHITIYSPEGKKIEETEYYSSGKQKWRKRIEWGENGKILRELVYDEHNKLVNYKKFEYNEFGKKKIQYTYNSKGKLIATKNFEYITEDV